MTTVTNNKWFHLLVGRSLLGWPAKCSSKRHYRALHHIVARVSTAPGGKKDPVTKIMDNARTQPTAKNASGKTCINARRLTFEHVGPQEVISAVRLSVSSRTRSTPAIFVNKCGRATAHTQFNPVFDHMCQHLCCEHQRYTGVLCGELTCHFPCLCCAAGDG